MTRSHKHCYVYEFPISRRYEAGVLMHEYVLLTDYDGAKSKQNLLLLEQGLRIAYGHYPKSIKFKYDKYQ